jgi:mannose-1-phosphate guanylyltransferase
MGAVHCLEDPAKIMLELIEVQTGSHLSEDDIRIEHDYGQLMHRIIEVPLCPVD